MGKIRSLVHWFAHARRHEGALLLGVFVVVLPLASLVYALALRNPPGGYECQFVLRHLDILLPTLHDGNWVALLTAPDTALGSASLAQSLAAELGRWLAPHRFGAFYLGTIFLTIMTAGAVALATRFACLARWPAGPGGWAALWAALLLLYAPLALMNAINFNNSAAIAAHCAASLAAYMWARHTRRRGAWLVASLVLALGLYVQVVWALAFMLAMLLVACLDEAAAHGWRAGLSAVGVVAGGLVLAGVWRIDWWRGADNVALPTVIAMLCASALLYVWAQWLRRRTAPMQALLAYMAPALLLTLLWLECNGNAPSVRAAMTGMVQARPTALLTGYIPALLGYCLRSNPLLALVLAGSSLAGGLLLARRSPGLLLVLPFGVLMLRYGMVAVPAALQVMLVGLCVLAGVGAVWLWQAGARGIVAMAGAQWQTRLNTTTAYGCVTAGLLLIGVPSLVHAPQRDFEMGTGLPFPVLDAATPLQHALQQMADSMPDTAVVAFTAPQPALSHLTINAFARLHQRRWQVRDWPNLNAGTAPADIDYFVLAGPAQAPSPYFIQPIVREHCAQQKVLLDAMPGLTNLVDVICGKDALRLCIYARRPASPLK